MDPTMENPILAEIHEQIMDFARDWARYGDRYVKGMTAGAIHAWYAAILEMKRTGQINISDRELDEIRYEYFSLIYKGWCEKE